MMNVNFFRKVPCFRKIIFIFYAPAFLSANLLEIWIEYEVPRVTSANIHSDDELMRFSARMHAANAFSEVNQYLQALKLIEEYSMPNPKNFDWPYILAFTESARIQSRDSINYDSIRRLQIAGEKTKGIAKVAVLRALSAIVEAQPDLEKALSYEKQALQTGKKWFRREKISDSAGFAPPKEGNNLWLKLKPVIEARIKGLERRVDIDRYGLDFVLYREAQRLRKAGHPASLDFTNIPAAFRIRNPSTNSPVQAADFKAARKQYLEITELFPEGVYTDASYLYAAVCLAHLGDLPGAMRELSGFYKRNPEGLYRGKALLLLGDLFMVGQWDPANAKEAYLRASEWSATIGERQRLLETYAVPEKSRKVSKPPDRPRSVNRYGQIEKRKLKSDILINRVTADWYLPQLRAEAEWKLGFLAVIADKDAEAEQHFSRALQQDKLLQRAVGMNVFNAYDRLLMSMENNVFMGTEEDMQGITGKVLLAMHWADFHFMLENFELAKNLYRRIQSIAELEGDKAVLVRAAVGEALVRNAQNDPNRGADTPRLYAMAMKYPRAPATPYLLWHCSVISEGDPMNWPGFFDLLIKKYPKSRHTLEARYNLILRHPWKYHEERHALIEQFKRDYPNEKKYHESLYWWDKNTKEYMEEREERWARERKSKEVSEK